MPKDTDMNDDVINSDIETLKKENEKLTAKVLELENNWKRALADYRNFQNRVAEEKASFVDFCSSSIILRILPTLDNLETLNKHIDDIGLKMITKELQQVLTDEGLQEVKADNMEFDTTKMDAVDTVPGEKNKVIEVTQKGYFLKDKLIRPTRVKVGNGESQKEDK